MDSIDEALAVLGLEANATPKDVDEAYRNLSKVWHPDRFMNDEKLRAMAEEKLKTINLAYETLHNLSASVNETFRGVENATTPPANNEPRERPAKSGTSKWTRSAVVNRASLAVGVIALLFCGIAAAAYEDGKTLHIPMLLVAVAIFITALAVFLHSVVVGRGLTWKDLFERREVAEGLPAVKRSMLYYALALVAYGGLTVMLAAGVFFVLGNQKTPLLWSVFLWATVPAFGGIALLRLLYGPNYAGGLPHFGTVKNRNSKSSTSKGEQTIRRS